MLDDDGLWMRYEWAIVECGGCEEISFAYRTWFSEDIDYDGNKIIPTVVLYPKRNESSLLAKAFPSVPQKLRQLYVEIVECYNFESLALCAGGLRALVEGICADKRIWGIWLEVTKKDGTVGRKKKKDLEGKIDGLAKHNLLTKSHAKLLHKHRFLGNKALHELQIPRAESLKAAIQVLEHTLENLYELKMISKRVRKRR
jgi:hypothetical protein